MNLPQGRRGAAAACSLVVGSLYPSVPCDKMSSSSLSGAVNVLDAETHCRTAAHPEGTFE